MLKRLLGGLTAFVFILSASARAAGDGVVTVEVDSANPPFMYGSVNHAIGLYPSIIETVFSMCGTPVVLRAVPWKRAMNDLDYGRAAVGGLYKTQERSRRYDFSAPLFVERIMVVYDKRRPVNFRTLADLNGKNVGVIAGWSYGDAFDAARDQGLFRIATDQSDIQTLRKLALGRLDVALVVNEPARALIKAMGLTQLQIAPTPLAENPVYLAFHKKARATALLNDFNARLRELQGSRIYQLLINRAFNGGSGSSQTGYFDFPLTDDGQVMEVSLVQ